jgi:putative endonuclease
MYHYIYILQSINQPDNHYVGYTTDIKKRLAKHNEGGSSHTSKYKPWKIKVAIAFEEKETALLFEKYLKTHS